MRRSLSLFKEMLNKVTASNSYRGTLEYAIKNSNKDVLDNETKSGAYLVKILQVTLQNRLINELEVVMVNHEIIIETQSKSLGHTGYLIYKIELTDL